MSQSTETSRASDRVKIAVDRVACTGHGICAQLLPGDFALDEWGYPIVRQATVPEADAAIAVKLCPARALYRA
jgi:ferredoxin